MVKAPAKPPAVVPPTVWPTQQKVTDLAEMLDRLYPQYQAMQKSSEKLETATEWSRKMCLGGTMVFEASADGAQTAKCKEYVQKQRWRHGQCARTSQELS
jgi:hypothetical protein